MALNPTVRTSGHFFQPFSELEDGESLACHYLPIYRDKDGKREYPLSVVLGLRHFSIYWSGYMVDETREYYGVHQLFSDDFTDEYNEPINNWLEDAKLIPLELLDRPTQQALGIKGEEESAASDVPAKLPPRYTVHLSKDKGYRSTYFRESKDKKQNNEQKERKLFDNFLLDLLFDLEHSSAFRAHPSRERFIGFLQKVPRLKAIWLKAEYRYNLIQLGLCKDRHNKDQETERKQLQYWEEKEEAATAQWLGYLRSPEGSFGAKDSKIDNWFLGVEAEHRAVFLASKANHLNKQAEDSIQWLIGRYAIWRAYLLQGTRVFGLQSLLILLLSGVSFFLWLHILPDIPLLWKEAEKSHWSFRVFLCSSGIFLLLLSGIIIERFLIIFFSFFVYLFRLMPFVENKIKNINNKEQASKGSPGFASFLKRKTIHFLQNTDPEPILLSIPKIANLLKPKILLASTAAWALILSSDFVWDLDFRISGTKWKILGALALVTFIFMATHITPLIERKRKGRKAFSRIFILGLISSVYSFIIGFVGMAATAEKHFVKDEQLPSYFEEFEIKKRKGEFVSNTDGNYLCLGKLPAWKYLPEFADTSISFFTIFEKVDSTGKKIYEREASSSKWLTYNGLHRLYHFCNHGTKDTDICRHRKVCIIWNADMSIDKDHSLDVHHPVIIVAEPLVFFTFVAVALGLMLEMGLQLNRAGIGIE